MVEALSPLHNKLTQGRFGASGEPGVALGTRRIAGLWQIAGWENFANAAQPVLHELGLSDLGDYRSAQTVEGATVWRISPDKLLIETHSDLSPFASPELMALDLGHARAVITLDGPSVRDLLSQVISVDSAASAFRPGHFIQTGIHHVGVLIHCTGADRFDILVPGTWAETVWELLVDNALPHGVSVKGAA